MSEDNSVSDPDADGDRDAVRQEGTSGATAPATPVDASGGGPGGGSRRVWVVATAVGAVVVLVVLALVLGSGGSSKPPDKSSTKVIVVHHGTSTTTLAKSAATTTTTRPRTTPGSTTPVPTVGTTTTTGPRTVTPGTAPGVNTTGPVALPETTSALPTATTATTAPLASTVKCQMTSTQVKADFYAISYLSHLGAGVTVAFSGSATGHAKTNATGTATLTFSPGYATPGHTTIARITGTGPTCSAVTSFVVPFAPGG